MVINLLNAYVSDLETKKQLAKMMSTFIFTLALVTLCGADSQRNCQDLLGAQKLLEFHESFYQMQAQMSRCTAQNLSLVDPDYINIRYSQLSNPRSCSRHSSRRQGGQLCPVHYVANYDNNRIPSVMVEARCSCSECIRNRGEPYRFRDCQPITYYTMVCRRSALVNGEFTYRVVWEPIQVGCHCVQAGIIS